MRIDKTLDEEIRREAARMAEVVLQSYLFDHGEMLVEIIKESVVEEVAAIYASYKIRVPWGLGGGLWVSDVRKWVRDRITVSTEEGKVAVDVRTSVEGMYCEVDQERFVALRMLQEG